MKRMLALTLAVIMVILALSGCNASQKPSGNNGENGKNEFKLQIDSDYADNIISKLEDSYSAGEQVTVQLETITENYYEVTVNGTQIPQADSSLEYTYFVFEMPADDAVLSITQVSVDIPLPPQEDTFNEGATASCISQNEDGAYILTLLNSGETIKLWNEEILFVPYISDELVKAAEEKIIANTAK